MNPRSSTAAVSTAALSALVWILPAPAPAAVVPALTLEDLTVRATDIVEGTVLDLAPRWAGGFVVTDVTVAVDLCLKGACAERTVVVQAFGGTLDGVVMAASGAAEYTPGESVLLFLEPSGAPGKLRTAGLALGKFRVAAAGDLPVVERRVEGLELLGPARDHVAAEHAWPLADLEARVAQILSE
jgi:hypothetical protein